MEVTRRRGLFATVDVLDFGLIRAGDKSKELLLEIVSNLEKGIEIETLYVERSDEPSGIYLEFASKPPIPVKCGARQQPGAPKAVAKVTFDTKMLRTLKKGPSLIRYRGKVVAESKGGQQNISVPYVALVYHGSLVPRSEETAFHSLLKPPLSRSISLTNELPFDVAISNITLGTAAKKSFEAKLLSHVITIASGETKPVIYLKYISREKDGFSSYLTLHTNVTNFKIPIVIFSGKLKISLYSIDQSLFDFGLLNADDSRSIQFAITNENPVPIIVKSLRKALPSVTSLTLLGIEPGNGTILSGSSRKRDWTDAWQEGMDFCLNGKRFAVFNYTLKAPADRTPLHDTFVIETDFERTSFPVKYSVDDGTVVPVPDHINFMNAFPERISSHSLKMFSTFKEDMRVQRITSLSKDRTIFFEAFDSENAPVIKSGALSDLGRLYFIPKANCSDDCYVGMPLHTADGQWFTYGMKLPQNLAEIDSYLYNRLRRKYSILQSEGKHIVNATIIIDTDKAKHIAVPFKAELIWPKLLTRPVVHFPLTAVGNFTIVNLTLTNPSSLPVAVQLLPLVIYPDPDTLIDFFRNELDSPLTDPIEMNETLMFSLRDTELFTLKPDSPVPKLREQLENVLGIQIPKFTLSMLLQPGMKVRVRVGFLPSDYVLRSSLLLIRNNLTVLEPVVLYGRGARMDMKVEGRAARTKEPLLFEIQQHHLSDCNNPKRLTHKLFTTLTVKRSFTILNSGEVPFTIVNISINNVACENRGFRILNCYPFRLSPNETHILDIAYTPDFQMSWNEAALQFYMHMNGTSWLFPIGASVPRHMLAKCHAALPRPPFESLMYYSCVSALIFCLVCIVACAYLEGDRTVTCAIRQQLAQTRRVFDLNSIGPHLYREENEPDCKVVTSGEYKPISSRRPILHYSQDSNFMVRFFWQTAGSVLWLFSFIWQFRGDETAVVKPTKARQTRTLVKCHGETSFSSKVPINNGKAPILSSENSGVMNRSSMSKRSNSKNSSTSSCSSYGSSVQNGHNLKHTRLNDETRSEKEKIKPPADYSGKTFKEHEDTVLKQKEVERRHSGTHETTERVKAVNKKNMMNKEIETTVNKCSSKNALCAAVQTTPTIEKEWLSMSPERSCDERSEAASDTSATPEWAVESLLEIDGNADEDFRRMAEASENLFKVELNTQQPAQACTRPPPVTVVHPIQNQSQQKKHIHKKNEAAASRNTAADRPRTGGASFPRRYGRGPGCKTLSVSPFKKPASPTFNFPAGNNRFNNTGDTTHHYGARKIENKPDGTKPSPFIEQLQKERKAAQKQYLKKKMELQGESVEMWPGFNLQLPTLTTNIWGSQFDLETPTDSVWRMPPSTNSWPVTASTTAEPPSPVSITESVRSFRLNPDAQPFTLSTTQRPAEERLPAVSPVLPPLASSLQSSSGYISDPLGLSGSLLGPANIWANNLQEPEKWSNADVDSNATPVYWAEKFLQDDNGDK